MQDRNAKAPKTRSGDQINPVLGTIIKVSALVVVAALVVLITLIIIEITKKDNNNEIMFKDRIHITNEDFQIIVEGQDHELLSKKVYDIMTETEETDDILFFFYYSNLTDKLNEDIKETVGDRDETSVIFVVDLNYSALDDEEEPVETIKDYILTNDHLIELNIFTTLNIKESGELRYPYFLLVFNEETLNNNNNPFTIVVADVKILENVNILPQKVEEE